jgi:multidrug efflux pump subunit AcrB
VSGAPRSLGPSGRIARVFQDSRITPLLALITLLAGLIVVVLTPKEEEPQIDVTMADVLVAFPGASAREVESLVAKQEGTNAVDIAERVVERIEQLQGTFIPDGVEVSITRNYGETADYKAKKLITKLAFATGSVVAAGAGSPSAGASPSSSAPRWWSRWR